MNDAVESAADALRHYEVARSGGLLRLWANLPNSTKRKWIDKAMIVLQAHARAQVQLLKSREHAPTYDPQGASS